MPYRPDHVCKVVEKLSVSGARLHLSWEAGPDSYGLYRQLVEMGHDYIVVAPSLIPANTGDMVKTDAAMLARLHRADEPTAVRIPNAAHEEIRSGREQRRCT